MLKQPEKENLRNENAISRFNDLLIRAKLKIQREGRQARKCVIEAHVKWPQQKIARNKQLSWQWNGILANKLELNRVRLPQLNFTLKNFRQNAGEEKFSRETYNQAIIPVRDFLEFIA